MRIAVFDYHVVPTNPVGGCHRAMVEQLCDDHDFTVFALTFDNPRPDRISWVRVPSPSRPLALLFVSYHLMATLRYLLHRARHGPFDLVQVVENYVAFGDVSYAHFCHRAFLRQKGLKFRSSGLTGMFRWLDHFLRAALEPFAYRRAARVVVPSAGLAAELQAERLVTATRPEVITNPVNTSRMTRPSTFAREARRAGLGLTDDDVVLAFVALGHFERKGLTLLLEAMAELGDPRLKLVVVGGRPELVATYNRRAATSGVQEAVTFVGMQRDVRPFLWTADAFVLPSRYETFSLATWEAAAAGLPVIVTRHHGTRNVVEGREGFVVEGTRSSLAHGLGRLLALPAGERRAMGERARAAARQHRVDDFVAEWSRFYGTFPDPSAREEQPMASGEKTPDHHPDS